VSAPIWRGSQKGHKRDTKRSQTFLNLVSSVVRNRGIGKSRGGIQYKRTRPKLFARTLRKDAPASFFLTIDIERQVGTGKPEIHHSTTEACCLPARPCKTNRCHSVAPSLQNSLARLNPHLLVVPLAGSRIAPLLETEQGCAA